MSDVALSRERGSKQHDENPPTCTHASLSHGSADRNRQGELGRRHAPRRSLTGARIETSPHPVVGRRRRGRSLTGARIETSSQRRNAPRSRSLSHGSADRNSHRDTVAWVTPSRSLTGARIETAARQTGRCGKRVALSRERGSKRHRSAADGQISPSLSHGSADRNSAKASSGSLRPGVALSRERGSKRKWADGMGETPPVALSRERGSKLARAGKPVRREMVALSRERGSKRNHWLGKSGKEASLSHGSADRNTEKPPPRPGPTGRSLTGARIETTNCRRVAATPRGRSLTGARIETAIGPQIGRAAQVALSRERGSKHIACLRVGAGGASLSHGSADRN